MKTLKTFDVEIDYLPVDWSDDLEAHVINEDEDFCVPLENFMRSNDQNFDGHYSATYVKSYGINLTDMTVSLLAVE
jgi:hypothetical protein